MTCCFPCCASGERAHDRGPSGPHRGRRPDGPDARLRARATRADVTLLAFGHDAVVVNEHVRVLQVGHLEGYDVDAGHVVLVRPDGYIGAITSSSDTLRAYLARLR